MNASLNYFLEANIGLILFLGTYALVLKNETDFKLQRLFLLAGILISLTFPLLHLQFDGATLPSLSQIIPEYWLPELIITADGVRRISSATLSPATQGVWFYLQFIYVAGVIVFLIRFIIWVFQLLKLWHNGKPMRIGSLQIVESAHPVPTFSFFNIIVLGESDTLSPLDKQRILKHEATHVQQLHSFDILLINILSIFFWFNPLLRQYKKYFVQIHEFEADARAVEDRDVNEYCSLLAKVALESAGFKLANHFNNSLTLKRIQMMKTIKQKIKPWKKLALASVIPLTFAIVSCQDQITQEVSAIARESTMAVDVPEEVQKRFDDLLLANPDKKYLLIETDSELEPKMADLKERFDQLKQSQIAHIELITPTADRSEDPRTFAIVEYDDMTDAIAENSKDENDVYSIVDERAIPPGGIEKFYQYVGSELRYPAQARRLGVEGKVFVEFIIQTDGSVTDARVVKGIGAGCDEAARNVIASSAKWTPGKNKGVIVKQRMVMPVSFALN